MNKFLKSALAVCAIVPCALAFSACGKEKHEHTYNQQWTMNETHHWHEADCCNGEKFGYEQHKYDSNDNTECEVCGYERTIYSVWDGVVPTVKPNTFVYDMDNRYIYLNNASAFVYFAWKYDMNDDYEARTEMIEEARATENLELVLVRDESDVMGENCFKSQEDWTIVLNANINLDNHEFAPIGNFTYRGFEGQGHIIKNFTISNSEDSATGLFSKLTKTDNCVGFNDLTIKSATIVATNANPTGIIAESEVDINNVHAIDVEIIGLSQYVGAICGKAYANVTNCSASNINIAGVEYVGGVVGYVEAGEGAGAIILDNLYVENAELSNTGTVNYDKVGAIVGGAEMTSSKKLDSLTLKNTLSFNDVTARNDNNDISTRVLGLNYNNTCIVK